MEQENPEKEKKDKGRKSKREKKKNGRKRGYSKSFLSYLADLLVVLLGVSIALYLYDWHKSSERAERRSNHVAIVTGALEADARGIEIHLRLVEQGLALIDSLEAGAVAFTPDSIYKQVSNRLDSGIFVPNGTIGNASQGAGKGRGARDSEFRRDYKVFYSRELADLRYWQQREQAQVMESLLPLLAGEMDDISRTQKYPASDRELNLSSSIPAPIALELKANRNLLHKIRQQLMSCREKISSLLEAINNKMPSDRTPLVK